MKVVIYGEEFNCKVIEDLGFQGGRHGKVVLHEGKDMVVCKIGRTWTKSKPRLTPPKQKERNP